MRFMMFMIPRVYQPNTPAGEKAGEGFAPDAETVAAMMKYNEELTKAGALIALDGLQPIAKGARVSLSRRRFTNPVMTVKPGRWCEGCLTIRTARAGCRAWAG
jgi:hypothetical protein